MSTVANDLEHFTDGLLAARLAGIQLDISDSSTPQLLSLKTIKRWKGAEQNSADFETVRLAAAFDVFRQTRSLPAAVKGLSFQFRARQQIQQLARRTILYLILIVCTAIGCLGLFWFGLRPQLEMIRADIVATNSVTLAEHHDGLMVAGCIILCASLLLGLLQQLKGANNWTARLFGSQSSVDLGRQALFWDTALRLVDSGSSYDSATETAGKLLRLAPEQQTHLGEITAHCTSQIASNRDLFAMLAQQKLETVSSALPTVAVALVGGVCGLICAIATFYPVMRLLSDMAKAAVI